MAPVKRTSSRASLPRSGSNGAKVTFNDVTEIFGKARETGETKSIVVETTESDTTTPEAFVAGVLLSSEGPSESMEPQTDNGLVPPSVTKTVSPGDSGDVLMDTTTSSNSLERTLGDKPTQPGDISPPLSDGGLQTPPPPINTTPLPDVLAVEAATSKETPTTDTPTEAAIGPVCPICSVVNCWWILNRIREDEGMPPTGFVSPPIRKPRSKATKTRRIAGPPKQLKSRMKAGRTNRVSAQLLKQSVQRSNLAETKRKLRREDVPHRNFMLNNLSWSPWKPVLAPSNTNIPKGWRARGNGKMGMRNTKVFDKTEDGPAVYEMAVQPAPKSKCYPVHFMATRGTTGNPQSRVLRHPRAKAEVERVLQRGCKVFMRRARLSDSEKVKVGTQSVDSVKELRNLVKQVYDYPWSNPTTKPGRKVLKRSLTIASGQTNL